MNTGINLNIAGVEFDNDAERAVLKTTKITKSFALPLMMSTTESSIT